MSENFIPHPLYPEYVPDSAENESAPLEQAGPIPGYTQPIIPFGLSPYNELFYSRRDPLEPGPNSIMNPKVPIPRTTRVVNYTSSARVGRACENCREQKAKCSGHRPSCHRCQDAGVPCSYGDRKREKMLKQLDEFTAQINTYEALLRDLYPRLEAPLAQHVDQTLGRKSVRSPSISFSDGEASSYPLGITDHTAEDFNRDEKVRAMGFVGEHSELAWLYKLKRDLDCETSTAVGETPDQVNVSISSLNYFQDDAEISSLDHVELSKRPPRHIADHLVDIYFQTVHPAFPIIGKGVFLGQYRSFYTNPNVRPGKRWIAILNLVFAIAARYTFLLGDGLEGDGDDHLSYFARAWRLSMDNVALLDHPNLQQVQVEGLTAFYLLSTCQVNRSWRIIGIAIRSAVALGLNLRSETGSVAQLSKETRYRVWWALFMLDTVLCVRTGRPPSTAVAFCTTPLPIPYIEEDFGVQGIVQIIDNLSIRNNLMNSLLTSAGGTPSPSEGSSDPAYFPKISSQKGKEVENTLMDLNETITPNISLYFLYGVDLDNLTREAIQTLYAPGATKRSWMEMEIAISHLNTNADKWHSRLPAEFHFANLDATATDPFVRQRADLGFRFYNTKLVISQPCLRHLAYQAPTTSPGGALCGTMAAICVQMACKMLDMLPTEPDAI
ncbi:hypothetical protein F1880_001508 [Penicillium rolfsii]|nr:hypothetical protein F1880_001508 [Penicillium rolfsii]